MPRLTFENKITLGNAIQIGLIVFSVIAAYYGIIGRADASARDIAILQATVETIPSIDNRLSTVETRINIGQAAREQFQDKTEATLERIQTQNAQIMAQLAALTATIKAGGFNP